MKRELAPNLRVAKNMVENNVPEVWDVLEEVVQERPVLLNRAPTLHRLGIQAFWPILVDGKAITIHPLVCSAFNADFDGDMMAVHLPLSSKAVLEAKNLILSSQNILSSSNGRPVTVPSQDMILGLHYMTKVRNNTKGEGITFASMDEVVTAFECERVALHARIKVRLDDGSVIDSTVGRVVLYKALPLGSDFDWVNKILKKRDLGQLIEKIYYTFGSDATVTCLDKIKKLGFYYSTMSGISLSIGDLISPENKDELIQKAEKEVTRIEKLYREGIITNGERYNKIISTWTHATAHIAKSMLKVFEEQDVRAYENKDKACNPFNPVFIFLDSGARGTNDQIKQLVGMRGLMARPSGDLMETPVKTNFKDGLSVYEYFISTHGARKGQADTALKTANSGYLTRRLVDVAQDVVITMNDCKTLGALSIKDLKEGGDVIYPIHSRAYGRFVAADVKDLITGEILVKQGEVVTRELAQKISESAVSDIVVRSVLTCQAKRGVCVKCYGYDLSKGKTVDIGVTVGIIAAQSIGEPGTQLTMRTFHIGGIAIGGISQSGFVAKHAGAIKLRDVKTIKNRDNIDVVLSRKGKLFITTKDGREVQEHDLAYGTLLHVKDGQTVKEGDKLAEWDANAKVILTEFAGKIRYSDLIPHVTMQEEYDDASQTSETVVLATKKQDYQPSLIIEDEQGEQIGHYYLPTGSYLAVEDGQAVEAGDVLVKMPEEASKTKDITVGGLPRIAELFEARSPKDPAILADIDGTVSFDGLQRGMRKVTVSSGDVSFDYLIPRGKQLNVQEGDRVSVGDQLTTGTPVLHDLLRVLGPETLQRYLVDRIQEIYRLQGIDINDRHIEVIARQMMRKVRVVEQGDSGFLVGDRVDRIHLQAVNEQLQVEGKRIAISKPLLTGITMASLGTESPLAAAAFQETTRILSEAAVAGQTDYLYGLKENLVIGKLIPAGTGVPSFREKYIGRNLSDIERRAEEEELKLSQRVEEDV